MYSVRCRLSLDFHLSCLWKTWPSGQAISSPSQLGGQGDEAQSIKLSRHDIRFIFACQEEFVEGETTRARAAFQTGRTAGLLPSRMRIFFLRLLPKMSRQLKVCSRKSISLSLESYRHPGNAR